MKVYGLSDETIRNWQWSDPLLRHLTDRILSHVDEPAGRALDVGCGTGRVAVALARRGFTVDAIDVAPDVVEQARRIAEELGVRVDYRVADFARAPAEFAAASYDLVVCSEVLEHVDDWTRVVENIRRVLRANGALLLTVPNDPDQFSVLDEYAGHLRRYRWTDLEPALEGFAVESAYTIGFPLTRAVHWAYTRLAVPFVFRRHAPERMWQSGSLYRRAGAEMLYRFARFDDLFNRARRGTTWVVKARKR